MTSLFSNTSLWEVLGWTMLHFLWMGSIAFVISAGVRWSVRRCSAGLRYAVALLCLLGVTATAAVALFVSQRQVGNAVAGATGSVSLPAEPSSAEAPPLPVDWMPPDGLRTAAQSQPAIPPQTAQEALREWVFQGTLNAIAALLPWLWICGTPLVLLALLTGIFGTTRLRRRSTELSDERLRGRLDRLGTLLGISRRVGLAVCDQVSSPLVIGIVRPLIILPPAMISGLAPAQLEMILLHELAHVRRWDNLVNLLQRAIEALLFYHPAVWWVSRWVRLEREHCCDALVLAHDHTPQAYAETLAALALPELAPQFATAAMANHQLTSRICHILNVEERTMNISMRTLFGGIVLLAAGAGGFLLATFRAERSVAADHPVADSEPQRAISEPEGRLMFGVGVNSDAGVTGHIVLDDGEPIEELLGLGPDDGVATGESLEIRGRHAWSANEATGMPNVPEAGDNEQAWASLTEDGQPEWLRLTFDAPVNAAAVMVYESFNPGALARITTVDSEGAEVVLWEGKDPVAAEDERGVAIVILHDAPELNEVTLQLDSPAVPGWNEIDAVGLIDRVTGEVHWADGAEASSSYAEHPRRRDLLGTAHDVSQCRKCHTVGDDLPEQALQSPRQRIEALRRELQRLEVELEHEDALKAQEEYAANVRLAQAQWQLHEDPNAAAPDELQQLRQTLELQQQAIERLTEMLDELSRRLNSDEGDSDSDAGAESGASTGAPAGPAPLALDFAFPAESHNVIDELVRQRLEAADLEESEEVTGEEFIRRVYLDLLGRLPTADEAQQFLSNKLPTSRRELIDRLLESDDMADNRRAAWSAYLGFER